MISYFIISSIELCPTFVQLSFYFSASSIDFTNIQDKVFNIFSYYSFSIIQLQVHRFCQIFVYSKLIVSDMHAYG